MVDDMINIAKTWLNRFKPDNTKTKDKNPQLHNIVWATSFTNCINLTDKEKRLNPLSTVIYNDQLHFKSFNKPQKDILKLTFYKP